MKHTLSILTLAVFTFSLPATAQVQKIITIAGTGTGGYGGDGGASTGALLHAPHGVAVDGIGNVYIQDFLNLRVRKINTAGTITTVAGDGTAGYTGDGSISSIAKISPFGIAVDKDNNVYISDPGYGVIRKINGLGIISTVAGTGVSGNTGNGGPATAAKLSGPYGLATDTAGNMYVCEAGNHNVRKISKTGIISRFAGNDTAGYIGDGAPATDARLDSPYAVAADRKGNVYISDMLHHVIRKVGADGNISTYAGIGSAGYSGDGGPAGMAELNRPAGIAVDSIGSLFIADADNNVIRKVDTFGNISTVVGNGTPGFGGDLGYVNGANLHTPFGVAVDKYGSIYIADANNQRIRKAVYPSVGVAEVNAAATIAVYPNPFSGQLTVSGLEKADKVGIYDVTGKLVSQLWEVANAGTSTFSINGIANGLYLLQVMDGNGNKKAVVKLEKE